MNNYLLWENDEYVIKTPDNPHLPYEEGLHIVVAPKRDYASAWEDPEHAAKAFELAAQTCRAIEGLGISPWFNIQANGNWGLLPGNQPFFHIHIYGRNKTSTWAKPLVLPEAPDAFDNDPMPEQDRLLITRGLGETLSHYLS